MTEAVVAACRRPDLLHRIAGVAASLLFLIATGTRQLAVVTVITAMYPAVTGIPARLSPACSSPSDAAGLKSSGSSRRPLPPLLS